MKTKVEPKAPAIAQPAEECATPEQPPFEKERAQFRALILANPNYFGNVKVSPFQPVLNIQANTAYEEIGCVGFQPQFNRLEAVVYVKQETGYGGDICSSGTTEYVRFYLSFDNGASWQDQGLTSFPVFNVLAEATAGQRLEYAVSLLIDPQKKFCFISNLVRARAILQWNAPPPPNEPDFPPVWGNVHNTTIQIDPRKLFPLVDILDQLKVKVPTEFPAAVEITQPVIAAQPDPLGATRLQALYRNTRVEPHRYALAEMQKFLGQPALSESIMAAGFKGVLSDLNIDLPGIIGNLFPTASNTSYEEMECIGLDSISSETLVGIIRVKLPSGYSGEPCTAGSKEFVTFWADFDDNGTFETCLGTTSVNVHDFANLPAEGLEYAVFLPVDFNAHRRPCQEGPKLVKIRAILSWQVAPPCDNPNYIPIWGNRQETLVQIKPGQSIPEGQQVPLLSAVGRTPFNMINSSGLATGTAFTGMVLADSPFGGQITLSGKIVNGTSASKYRLMKKPHGAPDSAYVPITHEPAGITLFITTFDPILGLAITPTTVHADAQGYYTYEDYSSSHFVEENLLGRLFTAAADDNQAFDLRVDLSVDGNPAHDIHSNVVTVLVDNKDPDVALDIDLGTGVDCADFTTGTIFTGSYRAVDAHFGRFAFEIQPSRPAHGVLPVPASGRSNHFSDGTIPDPGVPSGTYTLNTGANPGPPATGPMEPCGYSLTLHVWDRTNVNSGVTRNYDKIAVGFCLREPEE